MSGPIGATGPTGTIPTSAPFPVPIMFLTSENMGSHWVLNTPGNFNLPKKWSLQVSNIKSSLQIHKLKLLQVHAPSAAWCSMNQNGSLIPESWSQIVYNLALGVTRTI